MRDVSDIEVGGVLLLTTEAMDASRMDTADHNIHIEAHIPRRCTVGAV